MILVTGDELYHHGIRGQKWGERNGPPYLLKGGDYSKAEMAAKYKKKRSPNSTYNKKHFDSTLSAKDTTLSTLSYNKHRTENTDMFFAATNFYDKHQYDLLFNNATPKTITDENGKSLGSPVFCKFRINNKLQSDMKVASEDSGADAFGHLFKTSRDFYNFVTDDKRMSSYFTDSKYKFRGYREARDALNKAKAHEQLTEDDIKKIYRMFNYCIPFDGQGDQKAATDMFRQRARFFSECKKRGYGAVLDINDAIYGSFKARQPVIVFDMENIIPDKVKRTVITDKLVSSVVYTISQSRSHR